jgi:hypothetical protein
MRQSRLVAGLIASAVVVGIVGTVGLLAPKPANAQPPVAGAAGRFQVTGGPTNTILLDTQTGRTWLYCNTRNDSTLPGRTVDSNWCAMQVIGTPGRP